MGAPVTQFSHNDIDPSSIQAPSFGHDEIDPSSIKAPAQGQSSSWLDKSIMGYTPRGAIQGTLNALPMAGMVAGGIAGAETGPGAIVAAGLGDAAGESLKNVGEKYILGQDKTRSDVYEDPARGFLEGSGAEAGGKVIGKGIEYASNTPAGRYALDKASKIASSAPKWAAQKVGKIFAGIPEDTTARYMENPDAINKALPREQINDQILNLKNNADEQVSKAQEELSNAKSLALENKSDVRAGLQDQKFSSSSELQQAQSALNDKKQAFKEALKSKNLTSMAGDVSDAVGLLKEKVIKGSDDAYKILFKSGGDVETKPLINLLKNHVDSMMVNGVPASKSADQAISEIQAMQQRLTQMGNKISMPQAKQILQGLDKDISYSKSVGSFAPQTDQAFSALRSEIDQTVKDQVPEYRTKMAEVARQSRLLSAGNDLFGTPEKAISSLNNVTSQKGQAVHLPLIEAIGQETGKDLTHPVNDFITTHKILNTPSLFEKVINELPEAKAAESAKSKMSGVSNPAYSRTVVEDSGKPYVGNVQKAQSSLEAAKSDTQLFKGVTADTITGKTKSLNGANKYGAEAKFGPIDERYGTDFKKQIQARNDLDQFGKDSTAGSRKAVMGATAGAGLGYAVAGKEGAVVGGTIGSQLGGALDKYGGQIFKSSLDKGMVAGKAIGSAAETAGTAIRGAPSIVGKGVNHVLPSAPSSISNTADDQKKGPTKWANDGFQKLKLHSSEEDRTLLEKYKGAMLVDPKAKQLLITASNYSPGSKPLIQIMKHLKNRFEEGGK